MQTIFLIKAILPKMCSDIILRVFSDRFRKEFKQTVGVCLRCEWSKANRRTDQYKVTFTSTPSQSCHLSPSPACSTRNSVQDVRTGSQQYLKPGHV